MSIHVFCRECDKTYKVSEEYAGRRGKCKRGHAIFIPRPTPNAGALDIGARDRKPTAMSPLVLMILGAVGVGVVFLIVFSLTIYLVFFRSHASKNPAPIVLDNEAKVRADAARKAQDEAKRRADADRKAREDEAKRLAAAAQKAKDEDAERRADLERKARKDEEARRLAEEADKERNDAEAKRLAQMSAQPADVGALPPLPDMPGDLQWTKETKKKLDAAVAKYPSDEVSACLTFDEILKQETNRPTLKQREWLQKTVAVAQPRALSVLQRDFQSSARELDLRGAIIASAVAEKIKKNSLPNAPAAIAKLKTDVCAGKAIPQPIWKIHAAAGKRLTTPFVEGPFNNQITLRPNPGFRLVHVSARVQNISATSDASYALWAFGGFKRAFLGIDAGSKKGQQPSRFANDELIYLVTAVGEFVPCSHVCESSRRLRGLTITLNGTGGGSRMFFTGEQIEQDGDFQADVIFSVPQNATDLRLLVLGAAPMPIAGLN